jgi:hypothetical protein
MSIFIKAGLWASKKLGYKGELNLDLFVENKIANSPGALPYKVWSGFLTQSGTSDPVATVLENTIGSIVWSYSSFAPGAYEVVGTLPLGKSFVIAGPPNTYGPFANVVLGTFAQVLANKIIIKSTNSSGVMQDGLLYNHFIEIRVYN